MFGRKNAQMAVQTAPAAAGSVIQKDDRVQGALRSSGALRIDGTFEGTIESTGTVMVSEGALVKADITACNLIISGEVIGGVRCQGAVVIRSTARVNGDIEAGSFEMEPGANIAGRCLTKKVELPPADDAEARRQKVRERMHAVMAAQ